MMELFSSFAPTDAGNNNNNGGRGGRGGFPNMANLDEGTRAKFDQQMQELNTKNASASMAAIGKLLSRPRRRPTTR